MTAAVLVEFLVGDLEVRIHWMISVRREFATKPQGTDVGRVLEPRAPAIERRIGNRQCKLACFVLRLAHGKSVLAHERADFISYKLDDKAITHRATAGFGAAVAGAGTRTATVTFFLRLERERLGGVPSAGSTTMMLVTNFFGPCRSKSIEVRSESESDDSQPVLKVLDVKAFREGFQYTASF